jgi:hypothetical protein
MKKLSVFGAFRFSEFRIRDCVPVVGDLRRRRKEAKAGLHTSVTHVLLRTVLCLKVSVKMTSYLICKQQCGLNKK